MKQYIDKTALVEELKKRICDYWNDSENTMGIYPYALEEVIKYINTLETKEVDLEKELVDYHNDNFSPCGDGTLISCETGAELAWCDYEHIAKHFFELGLKAAQKGE